MDWDIIITAAAALTAAPPSIDEPAADAPQISPQPPSITGALKLLADYIRPPPLRLIS